MDEQNITIKYHYIRQQVNDGTVNVQYCSTDNMLADMQTKLLASTQFSKLCSLIGVKLSPKVYIPEVRRIVGSNTSDIDH